MIAIDEEQQGAYNVLTYAEIEKHTHGVVLSVIIEAYTNNNKWNQEGVLSDKHVIRAAYDHEDLWRLGINPAVFEDYLNERVFGDSSPYPFLNALLSNSKCVNEIQVSLPVRHKAGFNDELQIRPYINTFYPVSVELNGRDISGLFETFDSFGYEIVQNATDALVGNHAFEMSDDFFGHLEQIRIYRKTVENSENITVGKPLHTDENQK